MAKSKEEKKTKKDAKKLAKQSGSLAKEFKAFISRGNVLDMAVGVIMGSAFGAIVTAFTNILLSVCTWAVPGGISGLVTVLPAANKAQAGFDGIGQKFNKDVVNDMVLTYAKNNGVDDLDTKSETFLQWKTQLLSNYTLHGTTYTYNQSAIIDWGSFINAIISFLVIALTLFAIVKTVATVKAQKAALDAELKAKAEAKWAEEHPEEAAAKKAAEEKAALEAATPKKPDNIVLLEEIRDEIKKVNENSQTAEATK